jgi:hypothetical protein
MTEINNLAYGAEGIANAIGIKVHQVYNLRRIAGVPIHNQPGIGLVADPQELKAWLLGKHKENTLP